MNCLFALALAAGAAPQAPVTPGSPVPGTLDGNWTVVYAENVGRPITMAPALTIQNGTVTINLGQPVTYRLDVGPGHAIQAVPATGTTLSTPTTQSPTAAGLGPKAPSVPGATGVGSGEITSPGSGPKESPRQSPPVRSAPEPGTLQGVFVLSQEYLCISMSPVGTQALGASPGTTSGTATGGVASPGGGTTPIAPPVTQAAPNAAAGGVRQDAFILVLRRAAPVAPAR
jgi:hypothetical protein